MKMVCLAPNRFSHVKEQRGRKSGELLVHQRTASRTEASNSVIELYMYIRNNINI